MRAAYRTRVTAADVGKRVSVRHRRFDGTIRDNVGRLVGWFEDYPVLTGRVLVLVDRDGFGHEIPVGAVISSRVVPPHPRLEPEPDAGIASVPLRREASRVAMIDDRGRILLVRFAAAQAGPVWLLPGGGRDRHESFEQAARRELREETGYDHRVGPWIWSREHDMEFRLHWRQQERIFYVSTASTAGGPAVDASPMRSLEGLDSVAWFSTAELRALTTAVSPPSLRDHLAQLLRDGPPESPITID